MLQKRLVGLGTISMEHAQASALDLNELVRKFAEENAHKVRI